MYTDGASSSSVRSPAAKAQTGGYFSDKMMMICKRVFVFFFFCVCVCVFAGTMCEGCLSPMRYRVHLYGGRTITSVVEVARCARTQICGSRCAVDAATKERERREGTRGKRQINPPLFPRLGRGPAFSCGSKAPVSEGQRFSWPIIVLGCSAFRLDKANSEKNRKKERGGKSTVAFHAC